MIYRAFSLLIAMFLFSLLSVQANDIEVKVAPKNKISTANVELQEGDVVEFLVTHDVYRDGVPVIKKGQAVEGTITNLEDNDIFVKPASLYVENFRVKSAKWTKLDGVIYKKGNEHRLFCDIIFTEWLRGGEVNIFPEKDSFVLYLKD